MDRYAPTGNNTHQAVLTLLSSYLLVWSTDIKPYSLSYSLIMLWLSTTIKARWPSAAMYHIIIDIEATDKHDLDIDQYYITYIGSNPRCGMPNCQILGKMMFAGQPMIEI